MTMDRPWTVKKKDFSPTRTSNRGVSQRLDSDIRVIPMAPRVNPMSCRRTLIRLPAVLVAVAFVWACGGDSATAPVEPPPRPTTVTVSLSTAELTAVGATVQLTAEAFDEAVRA